MSSQEPPSLFGIDLFGDPIEQPSRNKMSDDFLIPPFSVLNAREGWWQARKNAWLGYGITSEVGRGDNTIGLSGACESYRGSHKNYSQSFQIDGWLQKDGQTSRDNDKGTSVFDPVLCELAYRWFCPPGGQVLDPFAGGSVRGIVAALLGRKYWGCELRPEQIAANEEQGARICPEAVGVPVVVSGKMMRQQFHACTADYVNDVCRGRCCEGSAGIKVVVSPDEVERISNLGATVVDGFIVADDRGLCPFKTSGGRCGIHEDKPFGCKASPFTLTEKGTVITRNRYRLLRCYKCEGARPAYESHRWSLDQIFGQAEAGRIAGEAANGADHIAATMPLKHYRILAENHTSRNDKAVEAKQGALTWVCGDALEVVGDSPPADFVFSCPPYGDLERYSDDPRDLSTMEYHTFLPQMKRIILRCYKKLKQDRFACFVVGEFRDKKGHYRNFVGDTINAFREVGFGYYNEAIVMTAVGSLPIRAGKQFRSSRKLGKTHQNLLVFVKGNGKQAAKSCGEI